MKKSPLVIGAATVILLALLVVFPLMSWYYLQQGMDYRKEILNKEEDLGSIVSFEIDYGTAEPFHGSVYSDKILVASFFDPTSDGDKALMGPILQKLHKQFEERADLILMNNLKTGNELFMQEFMREYSLLDEEQIYFNLIPPSRWEGYLTAYYQLGEERYATFQAKPFFLLLDLGGRIKRIYDASDSEDIKRMVAHTAMILPIIKERELIFKRETEK